MRARGVGNSGCAAASKRFVVLHQTHLGYPEAGHLGTSKKARNPMNVARLQEFTDSLRIEVAQLRHRGLAELADVLESVANDHEQVLNDWFTEEPTLRQAAEESGFSYSRLQQAKDLKVGSSGSPRIRRCDLPRKARRSSPRLANGQADLADEILTSKLAGE